MNTKKKMYSVLLLVVSLIALLPVTALLIWTISDCTGILASSNASEDVPPAVALIMTILCAAMWFLCLLCVNYGGCFIWVEDGILNRRGLLFGLKRSCAVDDILRVRVVPTQPKNPDLIYIIEKNPGKCWQNISKKSYICLVTPPRIELSSSPFAKRRSSVKRSFDTGTPA